MCPGRWGAIPGSAMQAKELAMGARVLSLLGRAGWGQRLAAAGVSVAVLVSCFASTAGAATATTDEADHILSIVRAEMSQNDLNAAIIRVQIGNRNIVTRALGTSMTGVPATPQMHFRNGAVVISYLSTVLLKLVDRKRVRLDDKLSRWLPNLPHANEITLEMLAASRSGYTDYVADEAFLQALDANPFRAWTRDELIRIGTSKKLLYAPGTSWNYAHTNFVVLGEALEKITGKPIAKLIQDEVLKPLRLRNTQQACTAQIPEPVLHAFTSERGTYEESTFWNPSWTLGCGLVDTTNIFDMATSARAIGTGALLSEKSHQLQIAKRSTINKDANAFYGLGIFNVNSWLLQNPSFSGFQGVMAYLPSKKISIAITTTLGPTASPTTNYSSTIFDKVSAYLTSRHS
jgi:D-alanyl-D-alanine carboxypeptidase